jgi:predicted metal-dependent phosphoesterase TrpH
MKVDLHTHSTCSDGALAPEELVEHAAEMGVEMLALTDHDTVRGHLEPLTHPTMQVIPGVEFSTRWRTTGVHVLGLNISPDSDAMREATASQLAARDHRARRISAALERGGLPPLYELACQHAGHDAPGRPHFAAALVSEGHATNEKQAFRRFLVKGRRGDVPTAWADLPTIVGWIRDAGGFAVLAHPSRYKLNKNKLKLLVESFTDCHGQGIEVISGRQDPQTTKALAALATSFGLLSSCGSDFHSPAQKWLKPGRIEPLPPECRPVWEHF